MEKGSTFVHRSDGIPEIQPLKCLSDLLSWKPDRYESLFCKSNQRLLPRHSTSATQPRFLCCHDMRGGYLEDRLVQGGGDGKGYTFRHWSLIDTFVYFSHHLVTVPPPGWTNGAHLHGVPVLGTFITEWEAGAATCLKLLSSNAMAERCAHQLATIAKHHGFDGWIVNIENEIPQDLIPRLIYFLKCLTRATNSAVEDGRIIWYDAVTTEGLLDWQNMLTVLNKPFFDVCDGIWLNYCWKEHEIMKLKSLAGNRAHDVYVGVDAFGRGCLGGGGMNSDIALAAIKRAGTSVALFACAWAFETSETLIGNEESIQLEGWEDRDERFWGSIHKAWACERSVSESFPISTSFCTGNGSNFFQNGIALQRNKSWYNLSLQCLQPRVEFANQPMGEAKVKAAMRHDISYSGGSCLVLAGAVKSAVHVRLFKSDIKVPAIGFRMSVIAHIEGAVTLRACLEIEQRSTNDSNFGKKTRTLELGPGGFDASLRGAVFKAASRSVQSLSKFKLPTESYGSSFASYNPEKHWTTWEFNILQSDLTEWFDCGDVCIKSIGLIIAPKLAGSVCCCNIVLGAISLEESVAKSIPSVVNLTVEDLKLNWQIDSEGKKVLVLRGICLWKLPADDRNVLGNITCHMWLSFFASSQDASVNPLDRWTRPQWFGVTRAAAHILHDVVLPEGATALKVFVATATATKVQSLQQAISTIVNL